MEGEVQWVRMKAVEENEEGEGVSLGEREGERDEGTRQDEKREKDELFVKASSTKANWS